MEGKNFYALMARKRKQKGYSQEELAHVLDISTVTISGIERGEVDMDIATYIKIVEELDIPIDTIFHEERYLDDREVKKNRLMRRLMITVIVLVVLNILVDVLGAWYNKAILNNEIACVVVSLEDDILTVKARNPESVEKANVIYRIKLDERLKEDCKDIKAGDVIMLQYYFKLSENGMNKSYKIRDITINNGLKVR